MPRRPQTRKKKRRRERDVRIIRDISSQKVERDCLPCPARITGHTFSGKHFTVLALQEREGVSFRGSLLRKATLLSACAHTRISDLLRATLVPRPRRFSSIIQ